MVELKIKIETEKIFFDEDMPGTEQYWYKRYKELNSAKKQLLEELKETLPEYILDKKNTKAYIDKLLLSKSSLDEYLEDLSKVYDKYCVPSSSGRFDIDLMATGVSTSQHGKMRSILDIIQRLDVNKDGVATEDILTDAKKINIDDAEQLLDRLNRNGQIYRPLKNTYKITDDVL